MPLDHLLLHMEFEGNKGPMGYEDKNAVYPRLDNLGLVYFADNNLKRDENGYVNVTSGHLHSVNSALDNDWMQNKQRGYAFLIGKDGREEISISSAHNSAEYDLQKIIEIANPQLLELERQYTNAANDSGNSKYDLAA